MRLRGISPRNPWRPSPSIAAAARTRRWKTWPPLLIPGRCARTLCSGSARAGGSAAAAPCRCSSRSAARPGSGRCVKRRSSGSPSRTIPRRSRPWRRRSTSEQREALAPGDEGDVAVDTGEEAQQREAPAQGEGGAREDVAGEDRHRGAMHLERALAVQEELAERVIVVELDQAEERRRALFNKADVAPPQGRR